MAKFSVPSDVTVDEFFEKHVPAQFKEITAGANLSSLVGKEVNLQFNVNDQKYCLKIKDGTNLNIVKGGVDKPLLTLALSEQIFLDSVTGKIEGMIDRFTDPVEIANPSRLKALMETKGTLKLNLKNGDNNIPVTMIFNGEEKPNVEINVDLKDWIAIQNKETTGQNLFMNGKLKFTGDMVLLMKLQTLI
ncbi:MAG: SCP2 sterol-binding domain-containing protein [Deltaproteobacteria bacterium]|nr:SCP2 sterol-binding domain-containing protein [Deltaproteobacteria bacterium]